MHIDPDDARQLLNEARQLERASRRSVRFVTICLAALAGGSAIMGVCLWLMPLLGQRWLMACTVGWVVFLVGMVIYYYRDRDVRPRSGTPMALGIVGVSVLWSIATAFTPQLVQPHLPWWIQQANMLLAGLGSSGLLTTAAVLARRQAR